MLMPKRTKYRKQMKGRNRGYATRGNKLDFGTIGFKATEAGRINSRQIEAARIAATRHIKRNGKIWIRVFPAKPLTAKPLEVRMGSRMIFEMGGVEEGLAREALALAMQKLPFKTKIVTAEMSNEVY